MSKTPIIIGVLVLCVVCSSSSSAAALMMGDEETPTTTGPPPADGTPSGPPSRPSSPPADGTPCSSGLTGVDNHYMNGVCVRKGCSSGYDLVNGTCISRVWYLPGGIGPHYHKYLSTEPSASCQANGEWKNLDQNYFNKGLNCAGPDGCFDTGKIRFCFKRPDENTCNNSASGYYGNDRDDRVKDCVWVPSLPRSKIFNTEADFLSAAQ